MASPIAFSLPQNFDLQNVVGRLGRSFQLKGYAVRSYPVGAGACLEVSRNTGGLNTVIGSCEGIKINFMPGANLLNVSFSDEQWTDKIIGFVVGWFTCWIPWIFTAIGAYNQYRLPKTVENELQIILGTVSTPTGGYGQVRSWNAKSCVSTPCVQLRRLRKPRCSSIRSTPWVGTITPADGRWKWRNSA